MTSKYGDSIITNLAGAANSEGDPWKSTYSDIVNQLTAMRMRAAVNAWERDGIAFLNSITLPSPGSSYGSGGGGGGWAMYVPPYKDPFMVRPLPATKNNNKVTTPRPDDDGYLTFEEAVAWYRGGSGQKLTVDLSKMNIGTVYAEDFNGVGSTKLVNICLNDPFGCGLVFGTITLQLNHGSIVTSFYDDFDFEPHSRENLKEVLQNFETWLGDLYVGDGVPFRIEIVGSIKAMSKRAPLFDIYNLDFRAK